MTGEQRGCRGRVRPAFWSASLFALLVAGGPLAALADFRTGDTLLSKCGSDASFADKQECLGYVTGAADYAMQDERDNKAMGRECRIDIPFGVTRGQLVGILVKYLKEHPEGLRKPGGYLIIEAFHDAFPCKLGGAK